MRTPGPADPPERRTGRRRGRTGRHSSAVRGAGSPRRSERPRGAGPAPGGSPSVGPRPPRRLSGEVPTRSSHADSLRQAGGCAGRPRRSVRAPDSYGPPQGKTRSVVSEGAAQLSDKDRGRVRSAGVAPRRAGGGATPEASGQLRRGAVRSGSPRSIHPPVADPARVDPRRGQGESRLAAGSRTCARRFPGPASRDVAPSAEHAPPCGGPLWGNGRRGPAAAPPHAEVGGTARFLGG